MDDVLKRRIADEYLHPMVKAWWYSLTERQRDYWFKRVALEKSLVNSRTKQTP